MPHEFDYDAAKAIFHGSNLHEVRADGVWLLSENIAPLLTSAERKAFIEHPLDSLWEMGKPSPSSQPVLRIPFTAADLAACFAVGAGALFAAERFGDSDEDLDETLEELDAAPAAKAAVRAAYAEFRKAVEFVGTLDALHEEDAQRKTAVSRQAARRVRKRLNIDDHLARVNAELEAELSAQQRELDENLALLEDGLAAKDEESIQKKTTLHNCADLQEAKSRAAAIKKRNEILAPLDDWKAKSVGYRGRRDMAANAWEEAAEAEAAWRKKLVQQLINSQQVPLPLSGSADDALPDVARAQPEAQAELQTTESGNQSPPVASTAGLPTTEIADAFSFVDRLKKKLGDVNNHQWLLPAQLTKGQRPTPATWCPLKLADILLSRGKASEEDLRRAFATRPTLHPWREAWQEARRERNAFGR